MDYEILTTLQEIRGMMYVALALFGTLMVILIYLALVETLPFRKSKKISETCLNLHELGKFGQIVNLCESNLKKKPNHLDSIWWLAKAKYILGEYDLANKLFIKLIEIEPTWQNQHCQPYIDKINKIQAAANKSINTDNLLNGQKPSIE